MSEEIQEIHEHAEEAHHNPALAPVTISMAILAVLVAAVSLLGHRAHTEELLLQNRASDQWAYYQAKDIRRHTYELFLDLMSISQLKNSPEAEKIRDKYTREIERYGDQQKDAGSDAKSLEDEVRHEQRRADWFDLGEVLLEAALVISSITLITRNLLFWKLGLALAGTGVFVAAGGLLVR
jgi:type VI protein secretion system component VasF